MTNGHSLPFDADRISAHMLRELRSDHAGETGAVYIYKGILAVTRDPVIRQFAHAHIKTEQIHLEFFDTWMPSHQQSALIPLWTFSGFTLGAISALFGQRVLFVMIAAVETFVVDHYQQQRDYLKQHGTPYESHLIEVFASFEADEHQHQVDAQNRVDNIPLLLKLWQKIVSAGCNAGVTLSRKL